MVDHPPLEPAGVTLVVQTLEIAVITTRRLVVSVFTANRYPTIAEQCVSTGTCQ